jgi:hypothetical protein
VWATIVTLSFRIGKVHHIILRCEALAEPRRRGRQLLRTSETKQSSL